MYFFYLGRLEATTKLFATKPMVLMSVAFVYSGVELAFRSAIYPTCVSFTHQLGANTKTLLALSVIVQSLGQVCCKSDLRRKTSPTVF